MHARLEQIRILRQHSFHAFSIEQPAFDFFWHYHPEYELTFIESGAGKRYVGNNISAFQEGDLVLLGPGLPHTWCGNAGHKCIAHIVQFRPSVMETFRTLPEFREISQLCGHAEKGLVFKPGKNRKVLTLVRDLQRTSGPQQVIVFLQLFNILCTLPRQVISEKEPHYRPGKTDNREFRTMHYIQRNWNKDLSIPGISKQLGLTDTAFCHFFKRMTGKTFSDIVNDIRVTQACNMLLDGDDPIPVTASRCGFRNLSYFNRVFRKKTGVTPFAFRKSQAGKP